MSEEAKDNFENGVFWELYLDLERQFQNFLEYVPYLEGNENVCSFKLLNLILSIGGHVDSAFKEMARYPKFSGNDDCKKILESLKKSEGNVRAGERPIPIPITHCLRAFEKEYKLSCRKVMFKRLPQREEVVPFKPYNPKTNTPEWWEIYNGLKHDVSLNIEKANLKNTRDALASAFLLNVVHTPSALRLYKHDVLQLKLPPLGVGSFEMDFGLSRQELQYLRLGADEILKILEDQESYYDYISLKVDTDIFSARVYPRNES
jgi:hypothetical protein